jgi:hypothetical protein
MLLQRMVMAEEEKKGPGASTFLRNLTEKQMDEMKDIRDGVKSLEIAKEKQSSKIDVKLLNLAQELENRFDAAIQRYEDERKEQDREHSRQIEELKDRMVQMEKDFAVSQARAKTTSTLTGGGIGIGGGGLIALLIRIFGA